MQVLLGCGRDRAKVLWLEESGRDWRNLVTIDINPDVNPDIVADAGAPLPLPQGGVEELHMYDVLEHLGAQGDWQAFFWQFAHWWDLMVPGGLLFAIVPRWNGIHAWSDPGHTRVIQRETLTFLDQEAYTRELDGPHRTNRTDYRFAYRADWQIAWCEDIDEHRMGFVLRAVKPSRITEA